MKSLSILLLLAVTFGQLGCTMSSEQLEQQADRSETPRNQELNIESSAKPARSAQPTTQPVSLVTADSAETVAGAADRKIIKNAELTLEVTSPPDAQRGVASIAEQHGGFVVTSETKQIEHRDPGKRTVEVKLMARVPSSQFDPVLTSIEKLANNVIHRGITGNDVTEEFIDLEARIRTQRTLEVQFIEIMKQASNISDALEVQRQIAGVRTEIERLEGRKRFLENRAALSTITVNLRSPAVIAVNTSSFTRNLREAVSDSLNTASAILLGLTRFVIVSTPILILIVLPLALIASIFVRRAKRMRLAHQLSVAASE